MPLYCADLSLRFGLPSLEGAPFRCPIDDWFPGTRYDPRHEHSGARKTSGTRSLWDTLTHPETMAAVLQGRPSGDAADDLASLRQGAPLRTSTFRKAGWRWRSGRLFFRSTDDAVPIAWQSGIWYSARRACEPLNGPIIVESVEEIAGTERFWVKAHLFRKVRLTAAGQAWVIAVPTHDVPPAPAAFKAHVAPAPEHSTTDGQVRDLRCERCPCPARMRVSSSYHCRRRGHLLVSENIGWARRLSVAADARGIIGHAGAVLLRACAN